MGNFAHFGNVTMFQSIIRDRNQFFTYFKYIDVYFETWRNAWSYQIQHTTTSFLRIRTLNSACLGVHIRTKLVTHYRIINFPAKPKYSRVAISNMGGHRQDFVLLMIKSETLLVIT